MGTGGGNTVAIIQARVGSRRLPGKVLAPIVGRSMLERVVERVEAASRVDRAVVATSDDPRDDAVEAICRRRGFACFRGSESDVLGRYVGAAARYAADPILRITADCPLIDPEVIDRVVDAFRGKDLPYDYASNINPPTFPHGLDTEILSAEALARADREARWQSEREHVTLYIRQHPDRFRTFNVTHAPDLSGRRWVVDEATDLEFVRAVYERMGDRSFGMADVLALLSSEPELARINAGIVRDEGLKKSLAEDQLVRP
jgi:spore coat polysaccharide biosynthesis protein SpsF (cytidylyltransferase family)